MSEFGFAVSALLGAVLAFSGVAKLRAGGFQRDLAGYRLLPSSLVPPIAAAVPWIEILLGSGLLVLGGTTWLLTASAALLVAFTAAMVIALLRGLRIACGCRARGTEVNWRLVATNASLIVVAVAATTTDAPGLVQTLAGRGMPAGTAVPALTIVVVASALIRLTSASWELRSRLTGQGPATGGSP